MNSKIKHILSCVITLIITVSLLCFLTHIMERKASRIKYEDFLNQEADFDVLFMGTSHTLNAVFPMELWNDYGIVSYNMGSHSCQIPTSYWILKNALNYTTPKLVVIDCHLLSGQYKCSDLFSFTHHSLDAFPLSITKTRAVFDLLDDPVIEKAIEEGKTRESDEARSRISLLWNFSVYHSRWSSLKKEDFFPEHSPEKGADSRIAVKSGTFSRVNPDIVMDSGTVAEEYLRRMTEECLDKGIDVLLTYIPSATGTKRQSEANYIHILAEEYGIKSVNFFDLDIINYQTDLYDGTSHLNPSGARKVTSFLGQYIKDNYDIPDQRENGLYTHWHDDYKEYTAMKNKDISSQTDPRNLLMLLSDDDIEITLYVKDKDILKDELISALFSNLGIDSYGNEATDSFIAETDDDGRLSLITDPDLRQSAIDTILYYFGDMPDGSNLRICIFRDGEIVTVSDFTL